MAEFKSAFLRVLAERGYIHQCSDQAGLDLALTAGIVPAYIGFDCTAPSLHVGSLVQIMMLRWLQKSGHKPIVLMGGGTTQVGDPSGKDESRRLLSLEEIESNKAGIREVFARFLTFGDGETDAVMVDNADWLLKLGYIPFLREVGRHISVNQMIQRDSVKLRLEREQHLSFLEFNYMVLQAYDFVELARRYGCRLQMGGSDQWGNIVAGIDLGRRLADVECFALTSPLIATASGAKMGKTADGAVWLAAGLTSPYDYWQYWRNTADADVGRFLRMFTELPTKRIDDLAGAEGSGINDAKKELATAATALLHGQAAADAAAETARRTFEEHESAEGLPTLEVPHSDVAAGIGILTLYVQAGLAGSNSEVRKAIANKAIKVNDRPISDPKARVGTADLEDGVIKLSFGRKKHVLVRPV